MEDLDDPYPDYEPTLDMGAAPREWAKMSKEEQDAAIKGAGKAEVISEDPADYTGKAIEIFEDLHGVEFNPKSGDDVGKLEKMKSMLADVGGIGDSQADINKFALQFYRNS